jgi:hypothetical protein
MKGGRRGIYHVASILTSNRHCRKGWLEWSYTVTGDESQKETKWGREEGDFEVVTGEWRRSKTPCLTKWLDQMTTEKAGGTRP